MIDLLLRQKIITSHIMMPVVTIEDKRENIFCRIIRQPMERDYFSTIILSLWYPYLLTWDLE